MWLIGPLAQSEVRTVAETPVRGESFTLVALPDDVVAFFYDGLSAGGANLVKESMALFKSLLTIASHRSCLLSAAAGPLLLVSEDDDCGVPLVSSPASLAVGADAFLAFLDVGGGYCCRKDAMAGMLSICVR